MNNKLKLKSIKLISESNNISEVLSHYAKNIPNQNFIIDHTSNRILKIKYSQFNQYVNNCCKYFKTSNLKKGDIISLILENSLPFLIFYFASIRYGAILNPLPTTLSMQSIEEKLNKVKPKKIFTNLNFKNNKYNKFVTKIDTKNFENFKKLINNNQSSENYNTKLSDTAMLYYSSGTTGKSKLIEYTNEAILENQKGLIFSGLLCKKNIHLCFLPLFHTASLRYTVKFNLCIGGTVILFKNYWSLKDKIWSIVKKYKINYFQTVPTILNVIINTKFKTYKRPRSIDFIGCSSAILPPEILNKFEKKFKVKISNLYGLSEIGCSHFENPFIKKNKAGSIGRILKVFKYKMFYEKNLSKNKNKIGELGVKGKTILKNYYKNDLLYKKSFRKGYFLTGDFIKKDNKGYFYYVDRKKDLIIKGGVNILPSEIENTIQKRVEIKEVAVTKCFDAFYGENICCFLVAKKNYKLNLNRIDNYCEKILGNFKKPKKYLILKELPKGPSGKVLKIELLKKISNEK